MVSYLILIYLNFSDILMILCYTAATFLLSYTFSLIAVQILGPNAKKMVVEADGNTNKIRISFE